MGQMIILSGTAQDNSVTKKKAPSVVTAEALAALLLKYPSQEQTMLPTCSDLLHERTTLSMSFRVLQDAPLTLALHATLMAQTLQTMGGRC